ncbi:hypothetical protein MNBD_GAMMA20-2235 [hydrothermal vent metagenome]|uniref:Zinc finger DksA/TraR C4-type domain-containing protein n=1 Tax=hydrothermal vent metagenome TaxID=652676 RepID=A0A3B1AJM2_9ZZZZ
MRDDSKLDLTHFRHLLLQRRAKLQDMAKTGAAAARTVALDQTRVGRLSRMDALQGQAMSQETIRRRGLELQRISEALAAIDEGEYGDCQVCDAPIVQARLNIDPTTRLCIACAEQSEQNG